MRPLADRNCRLYLITPPRLIAGGLAPSDFAGGLAAALEAGDVACVQLRLKGVDDDETRRTAETLAPLVQERGVAFLMNDRPDLAAETGCDGVHIGQEDAPYGEARARLGDDAIVGVTCHDSRHLAMIAADKGADYVAFGAFYATATKTLKFHAGPEVLEMWSGVTTVPCVAIGGITAANCAPLVQRGRRFPGRLVGSVGPPPMAPPPPSRRWRAAIAEALAA